MAHDPYAGIEFDDITESTGLAADEIKCLKVYQAPWERKERLENMLKQFFSLLYYSRLFNPKKEIFFLGLLHNIYNIQLL